MRSNLCDRADQASAIAVVLESMQLGSSQPWYYGRRVVDLHGTVDLRKITIGNHLRWLIANTNLEPSRAPVHELDRALGLERSNGTVDIIGHDVTTVQQAGSHVFAVARIAFDHLVVGLEAGVGDLLHRVGLVLSLCSRHNWSICNQREVDPRVWDQVGLELVEIDVE